MTENKTTHIVEAREGKDQSTGNTFRYKMAVSVKNSDKAVSVKKIVIEPGTQLQLRLDPEDGSFVLMSAVLA